MEQLNTIPELYSNYLNHTIKVYNENGTVSQPTSEMLETVQKLQSQDKTVYTIIQNNYGIYYPYFSGKYEVYPEKVRNGYLKSYGYFEGLTGTDESTMIIGKVNEVIKNISLTEQMKLLNN